MSKIQSYIAFMLTVVYLMGLSLQGLPALIQASDTLGSPAIEKQCPNKIPHSESPEAFEQRDTPNTNNEAQTGIFITCLSAQAASALQQKLNVAFQAFLLRIPFISSYHAPYLGKDPFPPRIA